MPPILIESLRLENFGPYYGQHEFRFSTVAERPGLLIGGKNGAGKTHLLRALYLAAVGESGAVDLKRLEAGAETPHFNFERCLNRRAAAEGQNLIKLGITLSLRDEPGGVSRTVTLEREIRFRRNSIPSWRSYAWKSDREEVISDEQEIQKLRDALLPRHLARFFFFDTERSQGLDLGQEEIVEGVSRILGLWTYGELESDLRQLIYKKIPKLYSSAAAAEAAIKLADLSAEVLRAQGHLQVKDQERCRLAADLQQCEGEFTELEAQLQRLGAVDPAVLQRARQQRTEIAAAKTRLEAQLSAAWEEALPLGLLGNYRQKLSEELLQEEKRREWEDTRAAVEPKIPQVKAELFAEAPMEFVLPPEVQAFYSTRLDTALQRLYGAPQVALPGSIPFITSGNAVSAHIRIRLANGVAPLQDLAEVTASLERLETDLRASDQRLQELEGNSAGREAGAELHAKRGELSSRREQLRSRLEELCLESERLEGQLQQLKREEANQRELVERAEQGQSLAGLAGRYREAAASIQSLAAVELRQRIAEQAGELWVEITERDREFRGMSFDEQWNCFLVRRDGTPVRWEEANTSAGQRQVRMLAFYEALRRLGKLVPPLVVDTPLARLDKEVRERVLNQLYLNGHQSILLTTNAEIDPAGPLFEEIKGRLARVYTITACGEPEEEHYEVRVTNDYFGNTL